jgi:hypothetical protein
MRTHHYFLHYQLLRVTSNSSIMCFVFQRVRPQNDVRQLLLWYPQSQRVARRPFSATILDAPSLHAPGHSPNSLATRSAAVPRASPWSHSSSAPHTHDARSQVSSCDRHQHLAPSLITKSLSAASHESPPYWPLRLQASPPSSRGHPLARGHLPARAVHNLALGRVAQVTVQP